MIQIELFGIGTFSALGFLLHKRWN